MPPKIQKFPTKELTLKEKVELIQIQEKENLPQRKLAEKFQIGKTQVCKILKRKAEIMGIHEKQLCAPAAKRPALMVPKKQFQADIDEVMWKWFIRMRGMNLIISGPLIQEKALEVARNLGIKDFKASKGWLGSFKERHSIRSLKKPCERADVDPGDWKDSVLSLLCGYKACNIFNMDETALFFRVLPDRTLTVTGLEASGGKQKKDRITISLCVSMEGEFEVPLVIGKTAKPRCFEQIDPISLPVTWKHNKKAWMTGELFIEWLTRFNRKMANQDRKVALLLNNVPCHLNLENLSHVKLIFLPAPFTSMLQPLDQGIIANIKVHYRRRLLQTFLKRIEECEDATAALAAAKCVTVLDAIYFVDAAVREVKPSTVRRCFERCGILVNSSSGLDENTDFNGGNDTSMAELLRKIAERLHLPNVMTPDEYVAVDSNVISTECLSDNWEEDLITQIKCDAADQPDEVNSDEDDESDSSDPTSPTFTEVMHFIKGIKDYAVHHNLSDVLQKVMTLESDLDHYQPSIKQENLKDFLS